MPDHLKLLGICIISLLALVQGVSIKKDVDEAMREGRAKPGDTVLLVAFGGGLTWGSVVMTL